MTKLAPSDPLKPLKYFDQPIINGGLMESPGINQFWQRNRCLYHIANYHSNSSSYMEVWQVIAVTSQWAIASQITGVSIVYSTVCSGADQRKHQSSASLAFVRGNHRRPLNSRHKGPVTRKMFSFHDVIMTSSIVSCTSCNLDTTLRIRILSRSWS